MLFSYFLKRFVKIGTINVIDSKGNSYCYAATPSPNVTLRLHSKRIEYRLCSSPMLALGEGYMNGELTIENGDIYDFLTLCSMNDKLCHFSPVETLINKLASLRHLFHQHNPIIKSRQNVAHHYDLSEDLYRLFLDKDMQYSCAYFKNLEDDIETAQENKKRHLAAKLQLKPGQHVLDIGCGWGGLAMTLAREADVFVTGLTLSEEQHRVATDRVRNAGLEDRIRFYLRDYRQEQGRYDRIISVGMFEHVGIKHYDEFFKQISTLLNEDGIAVLHSIGCSTGPSRPNPWLHKYIFPGGYCPALSETLAALEPAQLYVTDIEILHQHYAETLRHWRMRFLAKREKAKEIWGIRFCRMWEFYLASCEVAFRNRGFMVFQIQMVRNATLAPLTRDYIEEEEEKLRDVASQLKIA
ncbi:MAG TPA: cyclopropane-fatty-acyl-phospholipid synthase family protein [Alphaproteobacteria bacterium]|nr:cyclopropane-fatty-acyl-phospholipid synthase family protein [Alphaproteobacteria bacterium]